MNLRKMNIEYAYNLYTHILCVIIIFSRVVIKLWYTIKLYHGNKIVDLLCVDILESLHCTVVTNKKRSFDRTRARYVL